MRHKHKDITRHKTKHISNLVIIFFHLILIILKVRMLAISRRRSWKTVTRFWMENFFSYSISLETLPLVNKIVIEDATSLCLKILSLSLKIPMFLFVTPMFISWSLTFIWNLDSPYKLIWQNYRILATNLA